MKTTITPGYASDLLKNNTINRPLNKVNVSFLTNEIKAGKFVYNGEPIIISDDGVLIDGQHRLRACVEANRNIVANIVRDVPIEAMTTIDTGRTRTVGDVFSLKNIQNANNVSSICKNILDKLGTERNRGEVKINGKYGYVKKSNQAMLDFFNNNHEEIQAISKLSLKMYKTGAKIITPTQLGTYIYLFSYESSKDAIDYFREIMLGISLRESNVASIIRNKLINDKINRDKKMTDKGKRELIIKGFRLYCNNESRKVVAVSGSEVLFFTQANVSLVKPKIDMEYIAKYYAS